MQDTLGPLSLGLVGALTLTLALLDPTYAQVGSTFQPWVQTLGQPVAAPTGVEGKALPLHVDFATSPGSAADRKLWETQMRTVLDYLRQAPVFAQPRGFYPEFQAFGALHALPPFIGKQANAPFVGGTQVYLWRPGDVTLQPDGIPKRKSGAETGALRVEFNYQYLSSPWMEDDTGEMGVLDYRGEFQGFPIINDALLITRDGRLPYRPVSQDRVLKAWLKRNGREVEKIKNEMAEAKAAYERFVSPAETSKRLAEIDKKVAAKDPSNQATTRRYEEMWERKDGEALLAKAQPDIEHDKAFATYRTVLQVQKQLDAMGADARKAPAWIDASLNRTSELRLMPEGQGAAVVEVDPDFFDPKKPRTQLRFAWVRKVADMQEGARAYDPAKPEDSVRSRAMLTALQQVNWREFADRFLQPR